MKDFPSLRWVGSKWLEVEGQTELDLAWGLS
jgi:hypothetical protein